MDSNSDSENKNKFCYIFGSFNQNIQNNKSKFAKFNDIDVVCSNVDETEVRFLLKKQFPDINLDKTKIDLNHAHFIGTTIFPHICYWQQCKFFELYNRDKINYTFDCETNYPDKNTNIRDFGAHLRDPDKTKLGEYLNQEKIDFIGTSRDYNPSIKKHYGENQFHQQIDKLDGAEYILFDAMQNRNWKLNDTCVNQFGKFISIVKTTQRIESSDTTINANNKSSMTYSEFLKKCYS